MKNSKFLVFTILFLLVSGCQTTRLDPLLLGQDNCTPPCWQGIQPGQTTKAKAIEILDDSPDDFRYEILEPYIYFGDVDSLTNRIHFNEKQTVDWIELGLTPTRLDKLIGVFGEPDYLLVTMGSGNGIMLEMLYFQQGISFNGSCRTDITRNNWIISPGTKMYSVYFTEQFERVDDMLILFRGNELGMKMGDILLTWAGYGKYPRLP